jgi:DNA repair exonuclease SbcCD ATPase subunit
MKKCAVLLLLLFAPSLCRGAQLDELRSLITRDMEELREQSRLLTRSLAQAKEELTMAYDTRERLKTRLAGLTDIYNSTLMKLKSCEEKLENYEAELSERARTLAILWIILAALAAAKAVAGVLRLRGARLPWIIDWLA